jgi:hypothetical protein
MAPLSLASGRHDPFWDMDGKSARRSRLRRRIVRFAMLAIVVLAVIAIATRLPTVDPSFLLTGSGRPILAAAIFTLLGATILLGLSKLRHPAPH